MEKNRQKDEFPWAKGGIFLFFTPLLLLSLLFAAKKHPLLSQFIRPETCSGCHLEIYQQWKGSMHNLAFTDQLFYKTAIHDLKGLNDPAEMKEAQLCFKCHTPIGYFTGYPTKISNDISKIKDLRREGIQCDFCHSLTGADKLYNAHFTMEPGNGLENPGTKRGPFKNSESIFHKSAFSKFHTESELCGTCHNVRHVSFGTKLETTYEEWLASPYNDPDPQKRVTCQGCHMFHRPGEPATGMTLRKKHPGIAAMGGPRREHIFSHYFAGGNTLIPGLQGDKMRVKMVEERLKHTATLKIDPEEIPRGKIVVHVTNAGAGHKIPTGVANLRQMWLEIVVKNRKGITVYQSGVLDKKTHLGQEARIYRLVFGNGQGVVVFNIAKAREILSDNRIKPGETRKEKYSLPQLPQGIYEISARLLYRSAPKKLLETIPGLEMLDLPLISMAQTKIQIKLPAKH